ncbi:cytochrome bc1 complex diheme cytochrome c subunit [Salinactinospora qingdaonensis]|uniref:Cytochrome bc1 complex cytochrome c subunit n=1 Tax=Salinactinospora qingdaonensis TaxID=702744 RepID=A0ABP7FHZ9_9ACTN
MKWITARRRHPLAGYVVVTLALALLGLGYAVVAPSAERAQAQSDAAETESAEVDLANGRELFEQSCMSCHGRDGRGTASGPSLYGVGAAAVDFQVSTGRMPSTNPDQQMPRGEAVYNQEQIDDLAAYVQQAFGGGPQVPSVPGTEPQRSEFDSEAAYEQALEEYEAAFEEYISGGGDTEAGQKLYMTNCAHCHGWSGNGGALTGGRWAPSIHEASPRQIYEAMITGPGAMPVFNDQTITPESKQDLIAYVKNLQYEPNPGGVFALNRVGQVAEGLISWTIGLSLIVACAIWITAKQRAHD